MSDYFCEHTFALVLRRLPVKALLQFRSVCKGWKELIDSPVFVQDHLSLQKPRFLIEHETVVDQYAVVDPYGLPLFYVLTDGPDEVLDCIFVGTHHGVICFYNASCKKLLLWNRSIRKLYSVDLPPMDHIRWDYDEGCFGFWIDPSTKGFKFVVLTDVFDENGDIQGVAGNVYSSVQRDWRVIHTLEECEFWWRFSHEGPPIMIQGVAHWSGILKDEDYPRTIISFDFVLERFGSIEMPGLKCPRLIEFVLSHWQGALALMCRDQNLPEKVDLYLRQEGSWVKRFRFSFISPIRSLGVFWMVGEGERVRLLADVNEKLFVHEIGCDGVIPLVDKFLHGAYISYDFVDGLVFP